MKNLKTRVPKRTHENRVLQKRSKNVRSMSSNERFFKNGKKTHTVKSPEPASHCESFKKTPPLESNASSFHMVIIRNIPFNAEKTDIEEFLSSVMQPTRVIVIKDKQGNSRGFAFAYFNKGEYAQAIIDNFNNSNYDGRTIIVEKCYDKGEIRSNLQSQILRKVTLCSEESQLNKERCLSVSIHPVFDVEPLILGRIISCLIPKSMHFVKIFSSKKTGPWLLQFNQPIEALSIATKYSSLKVPCSYIDSILPLSIKKSHLKSIEFNFFCFVKSNNNTKQQESLESNSLIIRNISFDANQEDVFNLVKKYGVIQKFRLPQCKNSKLKKIHTGYAFVIYKNNENAYTAKKELNDLLFYKRKLEVSFSMDKTMYENLNQDLISLPRPNMGRLKLEFGGTALKKEESFSSDDVDDVLEEEPVAEDFVKETQAAKKAALLVVENIGDKTISFQANKTIEQCEKIKEKSVKLAVKKEPESLKRETHKGSEKENFKSDVEEGKTLHVRGLSLLVGKDELAQYLKPFGEIIYVRIVKKNTEQSKPTAFVKFRSKESVDKILLLQEEAMRKESTTNSIQKRLKIKISESSLPLEGLGFVLNESRLIFTRAMKKEDIADVKKKQDKKAKIEKNGILADIGYLDTSTLEQMGTPKADIKRRLQAKKENNIKLNNPNSIVNPLRLCIRNLQPYIKKPELETIIKNYLKEDPQCHPYILPEEKKNTVSSSLLRRCIEKAVQHVSICYDKDKSKIALRRSRGFAFATFSKHELALKVLHYLNNNPSVFGPKRRPIVTFAIEDKRALRHHELLKEKRLGESQNMERKRKHRSYSRGSRQREKKRQKRLQENI
ncbi:RNA-binding protein 28-like [Hylaeus volcanicus]|uniref:RNA-binding protein 28-like n=1 Tax=Hylaeus volcanicus TaxID=313075 RepID=UPI0023B7C515|nr:RNA-binding protein 28-like [Hylaeus volcanicus]